METRRAFFFKSLRRASRPRRTGCASWLGSEKSARVDPVLAILGSVNLAQFLLLSLGMRSFRILMVLVCLAALTLAGCSSSAESADMDRAAIEAALHRYAEALDWPRGTGWEEGFNPIAPATWPVEQWQGGYELFLPTLISSHARNVS